MKVGDLTGHTSRVLLLATSPDNSMVASVAADETIRLCCVVLAATKVPQWTGDQTHRGYYILMT